MPKLKISQLPQVTTLSETDIAAFLADPNGVPELKRIGLRSLFSSIANLTPGTLENDDNILVARSGGAVKVRAGDMLDLMDMYMARIPVNHKWGLWLFSGEGHSTGGDDVVGTVSIETAAQFFTEYPKEGYVEYNGSSPFSTVAGVFCPTGAFWMGRNPNLRGWVGPRDSSLGTWIFGIATGTSGLGSYLNNPATATFAGFTYRGSRGQSTWWVEHNVDGSTPIKADCGPNFPYEPGLMRFAEIVTRNDGTAIDFYLDGTLVYTATTNIPPPETPLAAGVHSSSNGTGGVRVGMIYAQEDPVVPPTPNDQAFEYYRIEILDNNGDANFTGILEFELFEEIGGTNYALASEGGVATASMEDASLTAAKAIDGLITTGNGWAANNLNVWPQWLQVQLSQARVIRYYNVGSYSSTSSTAVRSPKDWIMYGSNNGTDWTELSRVYNSTAWLFGVRRLYTM